MADPKDESEKEPEIKVTDRRRVHLDDEGGSGEAEAPSQGDGEAPAAPSQKAMDDAETRADAAASGQPRELPPVDFTTFILSLGSSALVHMGEVVHPDLGEADVNLVMAKQTIDMLAMIREKTQGNLDKDESSYLDSMLYDLRLRFVEATKKHK